MMSVDDDCVCSLSLHVFGIVITDGPMYIRDRDTGGLGGVPCPPGGHGLSNTTSDVMYGTGSERQVCSIFLFIITEKSRPKERK